MSLRGNGVNISNCAAAVKVGRPERYENNANATQNFEHGFGSKDFQKSFFFNSVRKL